VNSELQWEWRYAGDFRNHPLFGGEKPQGECCVLSSLCYSLPSLFGLLIQWAHLVLLVCCHSQCLIPLLLLSLSHIPSSVLSSLLPSLHTHSTQSWSTELHMEGAVSTGLVV